MVNKFHDQLVTIEVFFQLDYQKLCIENVNQKRYYLYGQIE